MRFLWANLLQIWILQENEFHLLIAVKYSTERPGEARHLWTRILSRNVVHYKHFSNLKIVLKYS